MLDPSEEKLASVEQYFPPQEAHVHRYYGLLARRRLADHFLAREELDKALDAYIELAEVAEGGEDGFRAVGLAGQAAVYSRLERKELAAEKLAQAFPLVSRLDAAELPGLLEQLGTDLAAILFQQLPQGRQRIVYLQLTPQFRQSLLEQVEPALRLELTSPRGGGPGSGRGGRGPTRP